MDKVTLVTGANGFVGRALLKVLLKDRTRYVVAVDVQDSFAGDPLHPGMNGTYIKGDLSNPGFIAELNERWNFSELVHLAAITSQSTDSKTILQIIELNIKATVFLLEAAKKNRCTFLFPSSGLLYGNQKPPFSVDMPAMPSDFYSMSKMMCEKLIAEFSLKNDIRSVVFRIGVLYGPGQTGGMFIPSIIRTVLDDQPFPMTGGEQYRDFVFIDDCITALDMALSDSKIRGVFNLGYGKSHSMKEVAENVEKLTGKIGLVKLGAIPYRPQESWEYCLDISQTEKVLGWKPLVDIRDGLKATIAYEIERRAHS
jgi:nucleoside-diphosphate-sugar epimerase